MDSSLDGLPFVGAPPIDSDAGRIVTLRESVILMRGSATRSRTGFSEQLLSQARDTERHVILLEALRTKASAT